ncbi:MAG: 2-oxo acid dehydrogenase subunit E2 [Candidatus Caldarchaeum sp.]|nr:2-oxo acid dehydrogenase subunit E2 [Candidatus Caldarchaeum sp.]MDW8360407.1 2-oxo acid dehydrogenase subunit E2 [Candidatus Caldarchaeum sp.]
MGRTYRIAGLRKAVAERLGYSLRNSLPVALMTDYDASNLLTVYNGFKQKLGRESPSITAIITKAVGDLLRVNPSFNAVVEGDEVSEMDEVNIAVAVETPRGLYAPTIKNVDRKTVFEVEADLRRLSEKALNGTITLNELTGHSFTVSNLGHLDVVYFTPIINPPDVCILGIGAIRSSETSARGHLTLVFDHRVVDGAPAAAFLRDVKRALESLG